MREQEERRSSLSPETAPPSSAKRGGVSRLGLLCDDIVARAMPVQSAGVALAMSERSSSRVCPDRGNLT